MKLAAEAGGQRGEEAGTVGFGCPDLEVQVPRAAERSRAEQRAPEVGGCAAAPGDDTAGRAAERPVRAVEHAREVQLRVGVLRALHMQLVAGRPVEGARG